MIIVDVFHIQNFILLINPVLPPSPPFLSLFPFLHPAPTTISQREEGLLQESMKSGIQSEGMANLLSPVSKLRKVFHHKK